MTATAQTELQEKEANVQEQLVPALTDESLPAAQTLAAQANNVAEIPAPRFIP